MNKDGIWSNISPRMAFSFKIIFKWLALYSILYMIDGEYNLIEELVDVDLTDSSAKFQKVSSQTSNL